MFENLKKLQLAPENTAEFTLYAVEGEPVLILAPAGEINKPYFNELMRRSTRQRSRLSANIVNATMIQENRDIDRELYAKYVLRGWRRINDSKGSPVEATPERFAEFFEALPDYLFDEVRTFATNPQNFVSTAVDVEEISGNLQEG